MADLEVIFLDVGQGDGTWIKCPDGTTILVDLGSKKNGQLAGSDAVTYIKNQIGNVNAKINHLFLTHGDGDHYNLLPALRTATSVNFDYVHIGGPESDYVQWVKTNIFGPAKFRNGVTIFPNGACDAPGSPRWKFGEVSIYLLCANYPNINSRYKNEKSLVLMVEYKGVKLVLTGDAEANTENYIMNTNYNTNPAFLRSFGLKLGHHGSQNGSSDDWLKALGAKTYFASGDQKWGHPYCSVLGRVVKNGTVIKNPSFKHGFVCGTYNSITKDYDWTSHADSVYIFSTLYIIQEIKNAFGARQSWSANGTNIGFWVNDSGEVQLGMSDNLPGDPTSSGYFNP